ncbi:DUF736 family protein [Bradyrhizobium elkanii]|uniref:DUF736 family protein n=1 Tax=Bradyrhizobium elkanii TaxID=29448 RepID=UPI001FEF052D|nr:DUF736 family protein [Bradyrhizobium elkanii]
MAAVPPSKPSRASFFPRRQAGSSRPLRCKKGAARVRRCASPEGFGCRPAANDGLAIAGYRPLRQTKETDHDRDRIRYPHHSRRLQGAAQIADRLRRYRHRSQSRKIRRYSPDFRIFTQGVEVGSGRIIQGESRGTDYVSLSLAAPGLGGRRLCANLGRTVGLGGDGGYFLVWNPVD